MPASAVVLSCCCCVVRLLLVVLVVLPSIVPVKHVLVAKSQPCPALPSPSKGRIVMRTHPGGQVAEFTCGHGYRLLGSRWLKCTRGGKWVDTVPTCIDINECAVAESDHRRPRCSANADCINLEGSYACVCRPGYHGDGKRCSESVEKFLKFGDTCGTVSIKKYNATVLRYRRIVGGRQAVPGSWPWQVMIHLRKKGIPFAGGALVDKRWIVTLASVLHSGTVRLTPSDVRIVLGDYDRRKKDFQEQEFIVKRIIMYPGFDRSTLDKDIALIELDRDVVMGTYINKVCLVSGRKSKSFVKSSRIATITGWGTTRAVRIGAKPGDFSDTLREVNLPLVASRKCQRATAYSFNSRSQICAGFYADRKSPCYGDAGSPLVTQDPDSGRWALIGLFSWSEGCGQKHKFSYYTRVAKFRRWIVHTIKNS